MKSYSTLRTGLAVTEFIRYRAAIACKLHRFPAQKQRGLSATVEPVQKKFHALRFLPDRKQVSILMYAPVRKAMSRTDMALPFRWLVCVGWRMDGRNL